MARKPREIKTSGDERGQRWAAAVEPNWYNRKGRWERRIVYCHTSQMSFATEKNPHNRCKKFGGLASWERCSSCVANHGFYIMWHYDYPVTQVRMCRKDPDLNRRTLCKYDDAHPACDGDEDCYQRMQCVGEALQKPRVRLAILRD